MGLRKEIKEITSETLWCYGCYEDFDTQEEHLANKHTDCELKELIDINLDISVPELNTKIDECLERLEEYKWCVKCGKGHQNVRDLNKCSSWDFGHYWVTDFERVESELL